VNAAISDAVTNFRQRAAIAHVLVLPDREVVREAGRELGGERRLPPLAPEPGRPQHQASKGSCPDVMQGDSPPQENPGKGVYPAAAARCIIGRSSA
jgi:hypothetical protein